MQNELTAQDPLTAAAAGGAAAEKPLQMDETAFRALYERTAKPLWGYLRKVSGDQSVADDLLQESYIRMLHAPVGQMEEAHQKNYLFRIATNLLRDRFRAVKHGFDPLPEIASGERLGHTVELEMDMECFLVKLKPRERNLLWLAYVEGYDHREMASMLKCRAASIRPMLFRARGRLAEMLKASGWTRRRAGEEKS